MTLADKNMQDPLHCPLIYYLFVQNDDSHVFLGTLKKTSGFKISGSS